MIESWLLMTVFVISCTYAAWYVARYWWTS